MTEYRVKAIRRSTPEEIAQHEEYKRALEERDTARAYAVRRAQSQNPHLEFETWDELMAFSMSEVSIDTFNELAESGLIEIDPSLHRTQGAPEKKKKRGSQ